MRIVPTAILYGSRGTDWRLVDMAGNINTTGSVSAYAGHIEKNLLAVAFTTGTFTTGTLYTLNFMTTSGFLVASAELF
jgi:hypothetical protein